MSKRIPRRRVLGGSALLGAATLAGRLPRTAGAEPSPRTTPTNDPSTAAVADSSTPPSRSAQSVELEGLESFVDDRMDSLLADHDVVGASVAVVHDGDVELAAGYGESDRADGTPVDPDETAFRIGSVSKPLVWTAVMQLIEDGRIDPREPVDTYLESVSIPEIDDEPITMAHLATHTAGFEERFRGTWVDDPDALRPLPDVLNAEQPERVRPPGDVASYSNYGAALAAQVVADVAGTSFEAYVEEHLFDPLGMDRATFGQPVPDGIDVATGYTAALGTTQAAPELFLEIAPAGAATATASDMAQFLRAHLEGGVVDGERILESETVERMHEQWFTHHEALPGIAFGLLEDERDGVRLLEHNGAIPGSWYSYVLLVPEYDLGLFCAYNTNTGAAANGEFVDSFLEEYLPAESDPAADGRAPEPDGSPDRAAALEGTYRGVRIAESTHARLSSTLQAGTVDVSIDEDGYLVTDVGGPDRWVQRPEEPLVFEAVDGDETLAFRERNGEVTHLFLGFQAFERISWYESLAVHGGVAGVTTLGMLSGAVGWPLARAKRRFAGEDSSDGANAAGTVSTDGEGPTSSADSTVPDTHVEPRMGDGEGETGPLEQGRERERERGRPTTMLSGARARWIAGGAIACLFGFVAAMIALLLVEPTLLSSPPPAYDVVSLLPLLGALGTAAAAVCAAVAWREGYWRRSSRIHYALVVGSAAGFCWLLYYWNLLRIPP